MYYTITIQKFKNTDPEASSMLGYATIQAATSACFSTFCLGSGRQHDQVVRVHDHQQRGRRSAL